MSQKRIVSPHHVSQLRRPEGAWTEAFFSPTHRGPQLHNLRLQHVNNEPNVGPTRRDTLYTNINTKKRNTTTTEYQDHYCLPTCGEHVSRQKQVLGLGAGDR